MSDAGAGRALVTGAGGLLAHDLVPGLKQAGWVVTALGRADLDITDPAQCLAAIEGHDLVVNTAAYTAVDAAETDEAAAFAVNAVGAANVARACSRAGARVVHLSTDYVFDGTATEPYAVDHPVAPRSAYGRTKAAGEWAVRALQPDSWIVRTAWLYGAGGPNFVATMLTLAAQRDTLSVVDDQVGQPTWTADVAELIVQLLAVDAPFGTYHATASGSTTWHRLARAVFDASGLDAARVEPTTTAAFPRPAARPAYGVLAHNSLVAARVAPIGDWRDRLDAYLAHAAVN
ncbi:dTDP-4-dehydrorhamnose reductase [Terrabacter koreensis]